MQENTTKPTHRFTYSGNLVELVPDREGDFLIFVSNQWGKFPSGHIKLCRNSIVEVHGLAAGGGMSGQTTGDMHTAQGRCRVAAFLQMLLREKDAEYIDAQN